MRITYKVYLVTNLINNLQYIGITYKTIKIRWRQHVNNKKDTKLAIAIREYGEHNFTICEIFNAFNIDELNYMEEFFIEYYNTMYPIGYNSTSGGKYHTFTDEVKGRFSKNMIERHKTDTFLSDKIAQHSRDKRKPIIGVNFQTFEIIKFTDVNSAINAGYNPANVLCGDANYANNMMWFYNKGESDLDFIQKTKDLNIITKGKQSWLSCDKEARIESMRKGSKKKAIVGVSVKTKEVISYESVHAALRDGYSTSSIYNCLNGKAKTGQKQIWFYKTVDNLQEYVKLAEDILNLNKEK